MLSASIIERIAGDVSAKPEQVSKAIELLNSGNTIPFIARYRKDVTRGLDEGRLERVDSLNQYFIALEQRRAAVLQNIEKQGKLTENLREAIARCMDKNSLEDLYLPYKRKRQTRAAMARAKGLEPLADFLWAQEGGAEAIEEEAARYVDPAKEVASAEDALAGAKDILAERVAEDAEARARLRDRMAEEGVVRSFSTKTADGQKTKFSDYYDFSEPLKKIAGHRLLAVLRGVREGLLRMELALDDDAIRGEIVSRCLQEAGSPFEPIVREVVEDAYTRLLRPSIENEVLGEARKQADETAIQVFRENTKNLLMAPPAGRLVVLGVDPGLRSGCKLAVVDAQGDLAEHATVYPEENEDKRRAGQDALRALVAKHGVQAVAVGNGTGSREALAFVRGSLQEAGEAGPFVALVNEAGASVYSASKLAREEFPELDVTVRGAISIARRLQDPLSELVKIEPRSIGVGQYQHDVNQKRLREGLHQTVVSCVNRVGVDLNTSSVALLRYVSGIQYGTAQNIVTSRRERGGFQAREQLLEVPGIGPKVYEQCAGFLRIPEGENVLDRTSVHPEAYPFVEKMAESLGLRVDELIGNTEALKKLSLEDFVNDTIGLATLQDIVKELAKPARDPRRKFEVPRFDDRVREVGDLEEGMVLEGMVTNVTDFGAFIDVGVHQDGLVHLSEMAHRFVKDPRHIVRVGEPVKVKVLSVDKDLPRISLSIKALAPAPQRKRGRARKSGEDAQRPESERPGRREGRSRNRAEKRDTPRGGAKRERTGKGSRSGSESRKPKPAPKKEPLNTQLADQLEALKEKLGVDG